MDMRHSDVIGSRWQKKKKMKRDCKVVVFYEMLSSSTEGFSPVSVYTHVIHHTPIESMSSSCRSVTVSFNMSGKFIYLRLTGLWFPRRIKKGKPFFYLFSFVCVEFKLGVSRRSAPCRLIGFGVFMPIYIEFLSKDTRGAADPFFIILFLKTRK